MGKLKTLAMIAVMGLTIQTNAAFLTIKNAGFELPSVSSFDHSVNVIEGWTVDPTGGGAAGVWNPGGPAALGALIEGYQVAYSAGGTILQELSDPVQPHTKYTLSLWLATRKDGSANVGTDYTVKLLAGNTVIASVIPKAPVIGEWIELTASVTTLDTVSGDLLKIKITCGHPLLSIDNVSLNATPVPEPSTYLAGLSALGMLALFARRNRQ